MARKERACTDAIRKSIVPPMLNINPLGACIGAQVTGGDLRVPLAAPIIDQLEQACLQHIVRVIRDQQLRPQQYRDLQKRRRGVA